MIEHNYNIPLAKESFQSETNIENKDLIDLLFNEVAEGYNVGLKYGGTAESRWPEKYKNVDSAYYIAFQISRDEAREEAKRPNWLFFAIGGILFAIFLFYIMNQG